jgi:hypothetical protein
MTSAANKAEDVVSMHSTFSSAINLLLQQCSRSCESCACLSPFFLSLLHASHHTHRRRSQSCVPRQLSSWRRWSSLASTATTLTLSLHTASSSTSEFEFASVWTYNSLRVLRRVSSVPRTFASCCMLTLLRLYSYLRFTVHTQPHSHQQDDCD